MYGQIQTASKSRMAHKTAASGENALRHHHAVHVFWAGFVAHQDDCHEAMHVQLRVQNAGWSPDVERWESDEDSDDSGDEREGDEQEVALSEAAILRLMA